MGTKVVQKDSLNHRS